MFISFATWSMAIYVLSLVVKRHRRSHTLFLLQNYGICLSLCINDMPVVLGIRVTLSTEHKNNRTLVKSDPFFHVFV